MRHLPKISPFTLAMGYAVAMPLVVSFLATPNAARALGGQHGQVFAAWAQAVGTVGAVIVALWVSHAASERERHRGGSETIRLLNVICAVAAQSRDLANHVEGGLKLPVCDPSDFTDVASAIRSLPIDKADSGRLAVKLYGLARVVTQAGQAYDLYQKAFSTHLEAGGSTRIQADLERVRKHYLEVEVECEQLAKAISEEA